MAKHIFSESGFEKVIVKKISSNSYEVSYHEWFKIGGWKQIGEAERYSKDAVVEEFGIDAA